MEVRSKLHQVQGSDTGVRLLPLHSLSNELFFLSLVVDTELGEECQETVFGNDDMISFSMSKCFQNHPKLFPNQNNKATPIHHTLVYTKWSNNLLISKANNLLWLYAIKYFL